MLKSCQREGLILPAESDNTVASITCGGSMSFLVNAVFISSVSSPSSPVNLQTAFM